MAEHAPLGLVDVYAASIPSLKFEPGVHVNYSETVLPFRDGLPKLKDFPAELGGSGETVPEQFGADHIASLGMEAGFEQGWEEEVPERIFTAN